MSKEHRALIDDVARTMVEDAMKEKGLPKKDKALIASAITVAALALKDLNRIADAIEAIAARMPAKSL